ncbi:MAG TPA: beta-L-arabinofuranosidase domain-containing protein [Anaerolineales bacterium]
MPPISKRSRLMPLSKCSIRPSGWIKQFLQRDAMGITGYLDQLCKEASSDIFFDKKVIDEKNGIWTSWWNGETEGNWSDALVDLGYTLGDPQLKDRAEAYLDRLLAFQEPDGYMGIYQQGHRFHYDTNRNGELWTQSRIMLALITGYKATENLKYLDALNRMATRTLESYTPGDNANWVFATPDEDGSKAHGLMIIEPMLILHQVCGREDVIAFSEALYEDYSKNGSGSLCDDCRLSNLLDMQKPFVGHGPHTCESLRIPLLLYYHTGKKIYWQAFQNGIKKLKKYMTLSGSCKSDELIGAMRLDIPPEERTFESLVESVPLSTAGYEYCSTTELFFTFLTALTLTGDLQYADMLEWLVFNAAKAAKQSDGKAIQYLCADNLFAATKSMGDRWDYSPTHTDVAVCCAPNSCRIMPAHISSMWMEDTRDGGIAAVLFGPCELKTKIRNRQLAITEYTQYPFGNEVCFRFNLDQPFSFPLKLRIPRWASQCKISVNQQPLDYPVKAGKNKFVVIDRTWQNGDELVYSMEWQPEIQFAIDGSAAVTYGPLLFCLRIPELAEHYHAYPVEGFFDTSYTPIIGSDWEYTLQLEKNNRLGAYTKLVEQQIQPGSYIWEEPLLALKTTMLNRHSQPENVNLVPIGCTILRKTTFPWIRR